MSDLTNFLTDLADQVKAANDASVNAERIAAEKALETGTLLCQGKKAAKHGEWLSFLSRAGVGERRARGLMQIARSGLKSATVADLGIKGSLDYLAKRKLPLPGDILTVCKNGWTESAERPPLIIISCSKRHAGRYDCAQIVLSEPEAFIDELPSVSALGAYEFIEMHRVPASEREFITMPDAVIEPAEEVKAGAIPESYHQAISALRECAKEFTPDRYKAAMRAVQICDAKSDKWPISSKLLDTYFLIARDDEFGKLCAKVQKMADRYEVRQ